MRLPPSQSFWVLLKQIMNSSKFLKNIMLFIMDIYLLSISEPTDKLLLFYKSSFISYWFIKKKNSHSYINLFTDLKFLASI